MSEEERKAATQKHLLEFQDYEIKLILEGLALRIEKAHRSCKWEWQESSKMYSYTPNREVNRLRFIERSIRRQLKEESHASHTAAIREKAEALVKLLTRQESTCEPSCEHCQKVTALKTELEKGNG